MRRMVRLNGEDDELTETTEPHDGVTRLRVAIGKCMPR